MGRRRAVLIRIWLGLLTGVLLAPAAFAQSLPIVVLDRERLYAESQFGQRMQSDVEAAGRALAAENRRIEAALEAEEQDLTERRAETEPDIFRELADEFDERVEDIRRAQAAKARALSTSNDRAQQLFFEQAGPVLGRIAQEVGALVVLDRRNVLAAADQVDITGRALSEVNASIGAGPGLEGFALESPPEVAPTERPETLLPAPDAASD